MVQHGRQSGKNLLVAALGLVGLCACAEAVGNEGGQAAGQDEGQTPGQNDGQTPGQDDEQTPAHEGVAPGDESVSDCGSFEAPEPVTLDTVVTVVATGQNRITNAHRMTPALVSDDSGLYWHDELGSLFAKPRGEAGVVQLLRGEDPSPGSPFRQRVMGMAVGADRIYITGGSLIPSFDSVDLVQDQHPNRIWSIPKQGESASVLLEYEDTTIWPIVVDGERLIVMTEDGATVFLHEVNLESPRLERLPMQAASLIGKITGSSVYWARGDNLLRSGFDDVEPQVVSSLKSNLFWPGPGYIVSLDDQNGTLYLQAEGSSCVRAIQSSGLNATENLGLDPQYIYHVTSGGAYGELARYDLESGGLTRLNMSGITLQSYVTIVGNDAESLYVQSGDTLLAVQKP